jgi:hypothetical protein
MNFPIEPTHTPYNGTSPTTIDLFLTKNVANYTRAKLLNELNSDHAPVIMEMTYHGLEDTTTKHTSFKHTDWVKLRHDLNLAIKINSNIRTADELEAEVTRFTTILNNIMKKHTSEIQITGHNDIPDEITRLMSERNKTRAHRRERLRRKKQANRTQRENQKSPPTPQKRNLELQNNK